MNVRGLQIAMKKKIYAVKKGWKPGIYLKWLDAYEQIKDYGDKRKIESFVYQEELIDESEMVEGSFAYAMKQAEAYMEKPEHTVSENGFENVDDEPLPFDNYFENSRDENDSEHYVDIKEELLRRRRAEEQELFKVLKFKHETRGNSPWLEILLTVVGDTQPIYTPNNGRHIYTGRYSVPSLYTGLLYLVLNTEDFLSDFFNKMMRISKDLGGYTTHEQEVIRVNLMKQSEYKKMKDLLSHLEGIDTNEVRYRNGDLASREENSRLVMPSKTYIHMKKYIKNGDHTIVDLYRELVGNPIYRKELLLISGPYENKDLLGQIEVVENELTMKELIMQTNAISIALKESVIGQNEAIEKLEKAYFHKEKLVQSADKRKGPRNVFLFAGPPGVGKTFMAEQFAQNIGLPYKRFDMSGYGTLNAMEEIVGISTFWKNAKPGVLTSYVQENPRCVLLFDEIEKADISVIRLFLQILDEGACFDRYYDANVSFKDAIVIFTTNAGKQIYDTGTKENLALIPEQVIYDALKKDIDPVSKRPYFPPEIVSRMSSHTIIMFNHLKASAIRRVIKKDIFKQLEQTQKKYAYDLDKGSDFLAATIQFSEGVNADARNASKLAGKLIDEELYDFFALLEEKNDIDSKENIKRIEWDIDFTDASDEIKDFYIGEKNCVIAIFGETEDLKSSILEKNHVVIKKTTDRDHFAEIIQKENVLLALVDYELGLDMKKDNLSIADEITVGRSVYEQLRENHIPAYILVNEEGYQYTEREKEELRGTGVEDFINKEELVNAIEEVYSDICCQNAIETLSLRHQQLTYETRNEIDVVNGVGKVIFYNLKLETAVDAEDKSTLISDNLRPNKKWSDIYVSKDVEEELKYFINYLQNPKLYRQKGARAPKGVLMYGPPGTGKTSLAKVVATESNINFLSTSGDELMQGGPDLVRRHFRVARKYAPAVLFIDEIDAIGANRGLVGVNGTLNALLTEMDGFKKVDDKPVFIMAATNLGGAIDHALERRFDRSFCVDLPDEKGRRWILERLLSLHSNMFEISEKELTSIVDRSAGMSPSALERVIETALRDAIRSDKKVNDILFDEAFEKCYFGDEREIDSKAEIIHTAYHEAGHALIHMYYDRKPSYMSVVSRGGHNGYVRTDTRMQHPTKENLLEQICASLGGRAAELEFGYGLTPGASGDLKRATDIATMMVCEFGMYEDTVGLAVIDTEKLHNYPKAEAQINQILAEQLKQARKIVNEHRNVMDALVDAVMKSEQKYLTQKDLLDIYHNNKERH